jgi:hypothetical protein
MNSFHCYYFQPQSPLLAQPRHIGLLALRFVGLVLESCQTSLTEVREAVRRTAHRGEKRTIMLEHNKHTMTFETILQCILQSSDAVSSQYWLTVLGHVHFRSESVGAR